MHDRMQDHVNQQQSYQETSPAATDNNKEQVGDYIDFEEVK